MKKKIDRTRKFPRLVVDRETLRQLVLGGGTQPTVDGDTNVISQCAKLCSNIADTCV